MRSGREYMYQCHSDIDPHFIHPLLVSISSSVTLFHSPSTHASLPRLAIIVLCLGILRSASSRVRSARRSAVDARLVAMVPALHDGMPINFAMLLPFWTLLLSVVMAVCFLFSRVLSISSLTWFLLQLSARVLTMSSASMPRLLYLVG